MTTLLTYTGFTSALLSGLVISIALAAQYARPYRHTPQHRKDTP